MDREALRGSGVAVHGNGPTRPIRTLRWVQPCWRPMDGSSAAATWRISPTASPIAPNGWPSVRRSPPGRGTFVAVAVVADTGVPISPCGACRQVLAEFGVPRVILANRTERLEFTFGGTPAAGVGRDSGSGSVSVVPRGTAIGFPGLSPGRRQAMFRVPRCSDTRKSTM